MARTCILRVFGLQILSWRLSLVLRLFCFASFRLYAFVEVAALCSKNVLRHAGVPIATRTCIFFYFFPFVCLEVFPSIFCTISAFSLYGLESTSYVLSFRMVLFYLVTTGWIFDIRLCEDSINQSINHTW